MRRRPWLPAVGVGLVVLLVLVAVSIGRQERLVSTLGTQASAPLAVIPPGLSACQSGVGVPRGRGFSAVRFSVGTYQRPGPGLVVTVRDGGPRGPVLARGVLAAGYRDIGAEPEQRVVVAPAVRGARAIAVCWRNAGAGRVVLFGAADAGPGGLTVAGRPVPGTARLLLDRRGTSLLSQWPQIAERAGILRAGWAGTWLSWALLAAVLVGVPALLGVALGRAAGSEAADGKR